MNPLNSFFKSSTKLFAFQFSSCQLYFLIPINKIYRIYNFKLITFGSNLLAVPPCLHSQSGGQLIKYLHVQLINIPNSRRKKKCLNDSSIICPLYISNGTLALQVLHLKRVDVRLHELIGNTPSKLQSGIIKTTCGSVLGYHYFIRCGFCLILEVFNSCLIVTLYQSMVESVGEGKKTVSFSFVPTEEHTRAQINRWTKILGNGPSVKGANVSLIMCWGLSQKHNG